MIFSSDPVMETDTMQADTQETDGGQKTAQGKTGSSFFREDDPVIQDFNAFFEKLSSIDDMTWDSESDANDTGTAKQTTPAKSSPARASIPQPGARRPKAGARTRASMDVFSSHPGMGEELSLHPASEGIEAEKDNKTPHPDPSKPSELAWALKMVLAGLVLFGLGLGAGWAALTLPERFQRTLPETAQNVPADPSKSGPIEAIKSWLRDTREKLTGPATETAKKSTAKRGAGQNRFAKTPVQGVKLETVEPVKKSLLKTMARKAKPAVDPTGIRLPVITRDDLFGNTKKRPLASPPAVGRFALQVGACGSTRCVQSYRALLRGKTGSDVVKVVTQPATGGKSEIHRIRLSPLTRAEAMRLKRKLIAADARFGGSYLVALP